MGGVVRGITQGLGLTADPDAGAGEYGQARDLQARAVRELEKLNIPSIEAQKIVLERPELVELLQPEVLERTSFEDIMTSPELSSAQMEGLRGIQELSREGFSEEDAAKFRAFRNKAAAEEQARQESILAGMAQRGALDSGSQLAAQLSSSQSAAQREAEAADRMAAESAAARRGALGQAAQMATQMRGQQFGEQAQVASAKDAISRFNAAQRAQAQARNVAEQQRLAEKRIDVGTQQQLYNKGLIGQRFQQELAKATGVSGAVGNQAQQAMQAGQMRAAAEQQAAAGTRATLIGGAKAAAGFMPGAGAANGGVKRYEDGGIVKPEEKEYRFGNEKLKKVLESLEVPEAPVLPELDPQYVDVGQVIGNVTPQDQALQAIRDRILAQTQGRPYQDGGMAYEDGGEGTIIPGEDFAGDNLPDRINSGEMVLNLDQQEKLNEALQELKRMKQGRADEAVDSGEAAVNTDQQDALMSFVRGEIGLEELPEDSVITRTDELESLLGAYQNGGVAPQPQMREPVLPVYSLTEGEQQFLGDDEKLKIYFDELKKREQYGKQLEQNSIKDLLNKSYMGSYENAIIKNIERGRKGPQQLPPPKKAEKSDFYADGGIVEDDRDILGAEVGEPTTTTVGSPDLSQYKEILQMLEGVRGQSRMPAGSEEMDPEQALLDAMVSQDTNQSMEQLDQPMMTEGEPSDVEMANQIVESANVDPIVKAEQQRKVDEIMRSLGQNYKYGGISRYESGEESDYYAAGTPKDHTGYYSADLSEYVKRAEEMGEQDAMKDMGVGINELEYGEDDPYAMAQEELDKMGLPQEQRPMGDKLETITKNLDTLESYKKSDEKKEAKKEDKKKEDKKKEPKKESKEKEDKKESKEDEELRSARNRDTFLNLLDDLDKALAYFDAANPHASLKPILRDTKRSDFEAKLRQARKIAADESYKQRVLDLQKSAQEDAAAERAERRAERKAERAEDKAERAQIRQEKRFDATQKETKKDLKLVKTAMQDVQEKKAMIKGALRELKKAENSMQGDSGPLDQYISPLTDQGQKLEYTLNNLALDKMTKMFEGMSKAIDSDSERKFFMKAQPTMSNYPSVNREILNNMLKGIEISEKKLQNKYNVLTMPKNDSPESQPSETEPTSDFPESQPSEKPTLDKKEPIKTYSEAEERAIAAFMQHQKISREEAVNALKKSGRLDNE
jgi:hypothetical protein